MKKLLNFKKPKTYNEKIQWLKLYNRKNFLINLVDKYKVRSYITEKIGEKYLIPLLWVGENPKEIPWEKLPKSFVIKANHGSGQNLIIKDRKKIDKSYIEKIIKEWLKYDHYLIGREWAYKNVRRKIIIEKYIEAEDGKNLKDYRFFCFNGNPEFIVVDINIIDKTKKSTKRNLYDLDWNFIDEEISYPNDKNTQIKKPKKLKEMIEISKILSKNFKHMRVDLYENGGEIYFGELTFYHQAGFGKFKSKNFAIKIGNLINIDKRELRD
jgi:hypothetical protein